MKLVEVFHTSTEAEARMWEEALKSKGIPAFVELPTTNQFLRAGNAGAAQPFDVWLIPIDVMGWKKGLAKARPEALEDVYVSTDSDVCSVQTNVAWNVLDVRVKEHITSKRDT